MNPTNSQPQGNQNQFLGQKVSVPGVNVNNAGPSQLLYQNDYQTQTFYTAKGNVQFGQNNDGSLGMSSYDTSNNLLFELDGQTWKWYDSTGNNIMQVGKLPDGSFGWAVATPGNSVSASFS
jgi:hypothetical protein